MSTDRKKAVPGRNGGTLNPVSPGEKAPPGAGRKPNPFREHIRTLAEGEFDMEVSGRLIKDGKPTGQRVKVMVTFPGSLGIVAKAYQQAIEGDAQARKWLSETGWGKAFDFGNIMDDDGGVPAFGFVVALPSNGR